MDFWVKFFLDFLNVKNFFFYVKTYFVSPDFKMWGTHSLKGKRQCEKRVIDIHLLCCFLCVWAHVLSSVMTAFTISGLFMLLERKIIYFGHFFSLLKLFSLVEFQFRILLTLRWSGSQFFPLGQFFFPA